ncbi:uncharacterized protein LOC114939324 isoform X1 [Nylanderia fulva]|uniref:uncharacterized protein LOC114939324 isoform X1 n=1 Tax=Nylanderia fulva TaxID=613905 RepID=UPI0010FBB727|nr:uncharacterized protein LOC114939324 isoform X1 [Nylanderia fulva]
MDTLQEYIFGTLNIQARISSPEDTKWFCIDYVLQSKVGEDIIVYTIFHSVARRLGLRCDLIDVDTQICIFWKSKFVTNNLENARCFYIEDENFPNCLHDYLQDYESCGTHYNNIKIGTEEMDFYIIKTCVGMFIKDHKINDLMLIEVNFNV